ncbi:MAG: teichoic acid transporter ATP-binding protein [Nocardioidaceae bacterium]|nr:teichoic acid transporter ATP-binding protein [Nocardioidaceae bacterium]
MTERKPVVVVDHLDVDYKILATGRRATGDSKKLIRGTGRGMRTVNALKDISFTAYEGESVGVIGFNGSGKSTLMRAIVGLTPATRGAVYAASRPNMLGVGASLIGELSGEKNVMLGGLALGFTKGEIDDKYDDIVDFAGLRDFIDMPMRAYSSGMIARLKFSIATSRQHEILIVDEALSVGDREFRERSEERIRAIREAAGTIFLVSHSSSSILDTCTRCIWIDKGVLVMDGEPEEVVDAYKLFRRSIK